VLQVFLYLQSPLCQTLEVAKDLLQPPLCWLCRTSEINTFPVLLLIRSSDHNEQALMLSSAIELWSDDLHAMTHTFFYMTWPNLPVASNTNTANTRSLWTDVFFWKCPTVEHRTFKNTWQSKCSKCSCISIVSNVSTDQSSLNLLQPPFCWLCRTSEVIFFGSVIAPLIRPQWTSLDAIIGYRTVIWWPACNDTHIPLYDLT